MSSRSDSLLCLKPINGVPITRIPRFDGVAIQWMDIVRAQPAETVGQRQVEQDHEIMRPWNIESSRGEPALQVFLHALLRVKAHGVERTILVAKGERVFRVSQIVLAFSIHCRTCRDISRGSVIQDTPFERRRP